MEKNKTESYNLIEKLVEKYSLDIPDGIDLTYDFFKSFEFIFFVVHFILAVLVFIFYKYAILKLINVLTSNNKNSIAFAINKHNPFYQFKFIFPIIILNSGLKSFSSYPSYEKYISLILSVNFLKLIMDVTKSFEFWYSTQAISKRYPITGYTQLVRLLIYIFGFIILISIFLDKSPTLILSAAGALTTILMLIFKDTITSFVSGIQISVNNLIEVGDWISVPSQDADGIVEEMSLNFVRIRNWDNTIVTIPIFKLTENSFTNCRNVFRIGARRIKTSVLIDQDSIQQISNKEIEKYFEYNIVKFLLNKDDFTNASYTNLTIFRLCIEKLIESNKNLNDNFLKVCRLLDPTEKGIPMEVYCFSSITEWKSFERIKSEIIEEIISTAKIFDIKILQFKIKEH